MLTALILLAMIPVYITALTISDALFLPYPPESRILLPLWRWKNRDLLKKEKKRELLRQKEAEARHSYRVHVTPLTEDAPDSFMKATSDHDLADGLIELSYLICDIEDEFRELIPHIMAGGPVYAEPKALN